MYLHVNDYIIRVRGMIFMFLLKILKEIFEYNITFFRLFFKHYFFLFVNSTVRIFFLKLESGLG